MKLRKCRGKKAYGWHALAAAFLLAAEMPLSVYGVTSETQKQLNEAKQQREQTENAIDANQDSIDSLNRTQSSLQEQLTGLDMRLAEVADHLAAIGKRIDDKNAEISTAQAELDEATQRAQMQYESMKKRIQFMYERGNVYLLDTLLQAGSFGEMLNRANYIRELSAYDRKMLVLYRQTMEEVEEKKNVLESEKTELESLHAEAEAEQGRVGELIRQTSGSLSATAGQLADAEANADALQDQLDTQNAQVSALEKQLAEERRLEALSRASAWRDISEISFAEGDRYLLANLIYCEAGNQPYDGQVAVGAVVMNRVMSGAFPSTIVGVIYQSNQFEPVSTGRLALALARDDATDACYAAADAAMAGQTTVADCIFFRTPIPQITPRYTIGGHIFY
ncbi:cell wall hydrolase [Lachnoclostridium sp. Marseille-P6806]|uniref:cell wall hydrolase n=1 Tax=Lachnoclostridium sp. Marseille-P6806 TaxID=2364793 RepID=UPI0010308CCA|nr:cell wall hydrolase [Lachnoclostridium sp. Marseille-P6806]